MSPSLNETLGTPVPVQEYLPTRNEPLNAYLGGGLLFGAWNEIYGDAGFFKTTFCAEEIVEILGDGGYSAVADREGRLNASRLQPLFTSAGLKMDHPKFIYRGNQPYTLTIEYVFEWFSAVVRHIRAQDLTILCEAIEAEHGKGQKKKATKAKVDKPLTTFYAARVGKSAPGLKVDSLIKALEGNPHILHYEHKSKILLVCDSVTATPSHDEIATGKGADSDNRDTIERVIRGGDGSGSNRLGLAAQAWSDCMRKASFFDERVCGLATAQLRTKGIGGGNAYQDAAEPNANRFYSRTRIDVRMMADGLLYASPDGGFYIKNDSLTYEQKSEAVIVGKRLWFNIRKSSQFGQTKVPALMIDAYGTDRAHTLWEYFAWRGDIEHKSMGRYIINQKYAHVEGFALVDAFTRAEFVTGLYATHLRLWAGIMKNSVSTRVII